MDIQPILTGVLFGLSTLLFVGPVFFYLLKSTLENGTKSGVAIAVGILIGDCICAYLAYNGSGVYFQHPKAQFWLTLIGATLLAFMGLKSIFYTRMESQTIKKTRQITTIRHGINGFLINFVNPFVFVVWLGFTGYSELEYQNHSSVAIVLLTTLVVIFLTDLLKVFFGAKLSAFFSPNRLRKLTVVIGIVLVLFSLRLMMEFI